MNQVSIEPTPTEEEAAAIIAALDSLCEERKALVAVSKWKLAGRNYGPLDYGRSAPYARDDS